MKKLLSCLAALMLLFTAVSASLAEEAAFIPEEDEEALIFTPVEEEIEEEPVRITAPEEDPFVIRGGVLTAYNGTDADVTVPAGVTAIGAEAFAGNADLQTVTLPESAAEIGESAFADCPNLEKITAPGAQKVGAKAFFGCAALRETVFAEDAEIAPDAFTMPEPEAEVPVITSQPSSKKIKAGGEVFFSVSAIRADNYQWQYLSGSTWKDIYNGGAYTGPYTGTLRFTAKATLDGIQYRCRIWNDRGTAYSNVVTFNILKAPVVTSQPSSKQLAAGKAVFFDVKASDAASWRWQCDDGSGWKNLYNDSTFSGVTGGTLRFTSKSTLSGRRFRCQVSNAAGTVYSNTVTFTCVAKPVFSTQPSSKTIAVGQAVSFTGKASGSPTYRWQSYSGGSWSDLYNDNTYSGVTTTTLKFTAKATISGRKYRLRASNDAGTAYSNTVTFTAVSKPAITSHPANQNVAPGGTVTFTASASNASSYRWQCNNGSGWKDIFDGSVYSGTTTTRLSFTAKATISGVQFRLSAKSSGGTVYSNPATFTIKADKPVITSHPTSQAVAEGGTVTFSASASGASSYRWQCNNGSGWKDIFDGSVYSGTATTRLSFTAKATISGVQFRLSAKSDDGTVYSNPATFTAKAVTVTLSSSSLTVKNGGTASLTANTAVTWSSSNTSVATVSSSGKVTGVYPGTATITASNGSSSARCTVKVQANYRALLISESTFSYFSTGEWSNYRNRGTVVVWEALLGCVHGPDGGSYTVSTYDDLSNSQIFSAISSTFGSARDGDVNFFMISTHGVADDRTNRGAGALLTYYDTNLYLPDLANALAKVNGKVIVVLEACGSGAATTRFNGGAEGGEDFDPALFTRQAIAAFAQADPMMVEHVYEERAVGPEDGITVPEPETNEFLTSKFVILTAAKHLQNSVGREGSRVEESCNYLTIYCIDAIGESGSFPADTKYGNGDGILTLAELYSHLSNTLGKHLFKFSDGTTAYQNPTIYPSGSTYQLFRR